ncbi:MAG: MBL fold metallo-hydrolase [Acidimicrobiaceae bacterium]|nr:MBL fold metallo-hydrolase [Acidimicrobiaceae bacterium]MYB86463.1 MBL fold metallo-hydrolase [Acidimicrobiaceae bacterium]MYH92483.1 MBL fold metallo-hydrolase [Acidimicrobiaceae bacterium]
MIESFAHVHVIEADSAAVVFDSSVPDLGPRVADRVRTGTRAPVSHVVLTHGHRDHAGGAAALVDGLATPGARPLLVGHEALPHRVARYRLTDGYNQVINQRQFGRVPNWDLAGGWAFEVPDLDVSFNRRITLDVGGLEVELRHVRAETDDHLWAWIAERAVAVTGDLMLWHFPNAGNPAKSQRYPLEWVAALRDIAEVGAELLLPGHGLPIAGRERIRRVLLDTASVLEELTMMTLDLMNRGASLDDVLAEARLAGERIRRPYLAPTYDEPEFVVRNVWRLYGGWYDGVASNLKPARYASVASELADLAGGPLALARRAETLAGEGKTAVACHLIDLAAAAEPTEAVVHGMRAAIYWQRRAEQQSVMAAAIYESTARESDASAAAGLGEVAG